VSEASSCGAEELPVIYLVPDNDWGISVRSEESRSMDAYEYAGGSRDGPVARSWERLPESYECMGRVSRMFVRGGVLTWCSATCLCWSSYDG